MDDYETPDRPLAAFAGMIRAAVNGDDESEITRKIDAVANNLRQMSARSGPLYELAQERSRIVAKAY